MFVFLPIVCHHQQGRTPCIFSLNSSSSIRNLIVFVEGDMKIGKEMLWDFSRKRKTWASYLREASCLQERLAGTSWEEWQRTGNEQRYLPWDSTCGKTLPAIGCQGVMDVPLSARESPVPPEKWYLVSKAASQKKVLMKLFRFGYLKESFYQ